jgi:hypothetical protein
MEAGASWVSAGNLGRWSQLEGVLDERTLRQEDQPVTILGGEQRDEVMRQGLGCDGGVGAIEGQAVLKLPHDQHTGNRAGQPLLDLIDHLLPVAVHLSHEGGFVEVEVRRGLEEAVGTAKRATRGVDQLPELEADHPGFSVGATELLDELTSVGYR